jgi:hypothetical protein
VREIKTLFENCVRKTKYMKTKHDKESVQLVINKQEDIVLVSFGMTSALAVETCRGDRTHGQQSVLEIAKRAS